ncbi:MAG: hypothetical protein DCC67_00555 [Planctomycetota bacterium]|nr:MAG: hypothetical protein DCC67_00555 [Planctomycetota bacterium]
MPREDVVIAVFATTRAAEEAVARLDDAGWRGDCVSLITPSEDRRLEAAGPLDQGDQSEKAAGIGAAAGATLGLLAGAALLAVPGIGPVAFAGAMASGLTGGLVGGLVGAMSGWGVKEDQVRQYEGDLRLGKSLVVVAGDPLRLANAQAALEDCGAERVTLHAESADPIVDR